MSDSNRRPWTASSFTHEAAIVAGRCQNESSPHAALNALGIEVDRDQALRAAKILVQQRIEKVRAQHESPSQLSDEEQIIVASHLADLAVHACRIVKSLESMLSEWESTQ